MLLFTLATLEEQNTVKCTMITWDMTNQDRNASRIFLIRFLLDQPLSEDSLHILPILEELKNIHEHF